MKKNRLRLRSRRMEATAVLSAFLISTLTLTLVSVFGCAPSKAVIDKTAAGRLIWPGPPDKPRVTYLWSLSQLAETGAGKRGFEGLVSGLFSGDVTDPRSSNTLMRPFAVFADAREKLYIADPGAFRVSVIDLKTYEVLNISQTDKEDFLSPVGVVADSAGHIYISDSMLGKVFVFDEKGKFLFAFEGDFKRPTCLAIDAPGARVYVSDTIDHRIFVYSTDGKRLGVIGAHGSLPGELNYPTHLTVGNDGMIYVTDSMNFRVQVFSPEGKFLRSVSSLGDTNGNLDKPKGLAVDSSGDIYVVDSIEDTVKIFSREGRLLLLFGEKGARFGEFWLPSGIFIDAKDTIYVADTYNMRIQAFQFLRENSDDKK